MPNATRNALESITISSGTAGSSFIFSNILDPIRWDGFVHRLLEREIYPVLHSSAGSFDATTVVLATTAVHFRISVQQLVLESSRWESDHQEIQRAGYGPNSIWQVQMETNVEREVEFHGIEWLTWVCLSQAAASVTSIADSLCAPVLEISSAVKRLHFAKLVQPVHQRG